MKKIISLVFAVFMIIPRAWALEPPLVIAINNYAPPFVLQTANQSVFGFDIAMIHFVCKALNRSCQFKLMPFGQILQAVENRQADMALGAITITAERAKLINFSQPYLESLARFMGRKELATQPFTVSLLVNKKIGVAANTVYPQVAKASGATPEDVIEFEDLESVIAALQAGDIDLALMDDPTAEYWNIHSSGSLVVLGKPFNYGFGLGIAVNKNDLMLLQQINQALQQYLSSPEFKTDFNTYFNHF